MKKTIFAIFLLFLLVYSSNSQSGWQVLNSGVTNTLNAACFTNFQTGYVCGTAGTIVKTTNGGINWTSLNSSVTYTLNDICFTDNMIGFCAGDSGIIKTTNAGANWISVFNQRMNAIVTTQSFVYSGGSAGLYRSTDFGENWTVIYSSSPYSIYGVYFNNNDTGQFMGADGLMRKTTNGGLNWFFGGVWYPGTYTFSDCFFFNSGSGFVCYSYYSGFPNYQTSYGIYKCNFWTNTSASWITVWYDSNFSVSGLAITGADTGYAVGGRSVYPSYQSLILKTTNGGNTWTPSNYNCNQILYDVFFLNSKTGYAAGRGGTILKTTDGGLTPVQNISGELPSAFTLYQNYPNPFNPVTRIKFDIASNVKRETANVKLIIYDILGREIASPVNEQLSPGTYEVVWDAFNYPSGVYFYKLITDVNNETKRMVLIK